MAQTRNIVLAVCVALTVVLMGTAAFLLYRGIRQFGAADSKVKSAVAEVRDFYGRDPFPSPENIEGEKQNVAIMRKWLDGLMKSLSKGVLNEGQKSPSTFMNMLSEHKNRLGDFARQKGATLPEKFAFGFDRYSASGVLPAPDDVPRLTEQLVIIDGISRIVMEAQAESIGLVKREEFEEGEPTKATAEESPVDRRGVRAAGRPTGKKAEVPKPADMYVKQRFYVELVAKEASLVKILNGLARSPMFIVVNSVEVSKDQPDVVLPERAAKPDEKAAATQELGAERAEPAPAGKEVATEEAPSRAQRMVCGAEREAPMRVRIEMDVYRFKGGAQGAGT